MTFEHIVEQKKLLKMANGPDVASLTLFQLQTHVDTFQLTTFENIVAHNEKFLLLPQYFHLYLIIQLIYGGFSNILAKGFQKHLLQIRLILERGFKIANKINLSFVKI